MKTVLIAVLAVTPLALVPGLFLSHDVIPKVLVILIGAALALFLLPQWWGGLLRLKQTRAGRAFLFLAVAQFTSLAVSALHSTQPLLSFAGTTWRRYGMLECAAVLVVALAVACTNREWTVSILRAAVASAGLASAYCVLQYFGVDPFLDRRLYAIEYFDGIVRPPATMGHAIYLGAYLAPMALIATGLIWTETSRAWRRIHGAVAGLAFMAIILSGSRGALLAVIAGAMVFFLQKRMAWQRLSVWTASLIFLVTVFTLSPPGTAFRHRLQQWRQDLGGPRLRVWRESISLIAEHPLLGSGPETFIGGFRRVESEQLSRDYPEFIHETPHNAFLDAAYGQGIAGLLILAGVFTLGWGSGASPGYRAALVALFVASMFASLTLVASLYLWCIAGWIAAASAPVPDRTQYPVSEALRIPSVLLAGVFTLVAFLLAFQDHAYATLRDAEAARNFAGAAAAWRAADSWSAGLPGYELWASRELALLGKRLNSTAAWSLASEAASVAEWRGEESFTAAYQSSLLAIVQGDLGKAETGAASAIRLAPNWYQGHLLAGQILEASGRHAQAEQEIQRSLALGWHPH